jgi:hypothetical protein
MAAPDTLTDAHGFQRALDEVEEALGETLEHHIVEPSLALVRRSRFGLDELSQLLGIHPAADQRKSSL